MSINYEYYSDFITIFSFYAYIYSMKVNQSNRFLFYLILLIQLVFFTSLYISKNVYHSSNILYYIIFWYRLQKVESKKSVLKL